MQYGIQLFNDMSQKLMTEIQSKGDPSSNSMDLGSGHEYSTKHM